MAGLPPDLGTVPLSVPSRVSRRAPLTVWVSWQFRQLAFHTGRPVGNSRSAAAVAL